MKELLPLTAAELARAERRLLNPAPGSRIAAALDGVRGIARRRR